MEIRGVTEAKKNLYPTIEELPNKKIRKIKTIGISALLLSMIANKKVFASDNNISPEMIESIDNVQLSGDVVILEASPVYTLDDINSIARIVLAVIFVLNVISYIILANKYKKNKDDEKLKKKIKGLKIASIILLVLIIISIILTIIIETLL